jgi:hypothetical protein
MKDKYNCIYSNNYNKILEKNSQPTFIDQSLPGECESQKLINYKKPSDLVSNLNIYSKKNTLINNSLGAIPNIDLIKNSSLITKLNVNPNLNINFNHLETLSNENFHNQINQENCDPELLENLLNLVQALKQRKAAFEDKSRLFCCGFFSFCMIIIIFVFYIFDVLKYQETCNKNKKNYIEICDAPTIGFWPRFIFISVSSILLIFSLYCTGSTVILFDPTTKKIFINKKKIFCLPSICEFKIDDLLYAYIESDTTDATLNLSNFSFYSVILVFTHEQINLSLGRDCFLINEKIQLVNKINRYLEAYRAIGEKNINKYKENLYENS